MNKIHGQNYYYRQDPNHIDRWNIFYDNPPKQKKDPFGELARMTRESFDGLVRAVGGMAEAISICSKAYVEMEKGLEEAEEIACLHRIRKEHEGRWLL